MWLRNTRQSHENRNKNVILNLLVHNSSLEMAIGDDQQNTNDGVRVEVQETNKT